ncbi:MAG TPA: agmatinase [Jatrophihabitantaceae bacterium]
MNQGPPDARQVPRFAGPATFARLPRLDEVPRADVAVLGVPFDTGTTYRPGARFGPEAIRAGSKLLRPYHVGLEVEPWTSLQVADAGDVSANPFDIVEAVGQIESAANALYNKADRIVTLGGDHTVALPLLRAARAQHGPIALIHFDAHLDTWDTYFGARFTHGTPFRRASEEGLLALDHCAHVGIRNSVFAASDFDDDRRRGFATVTTLDVARRGVDEALDRVRERVDSHPVYISIDIDVLDPAHAPGTGTPEPGGLTTRELQLFLHGLVDLPIIGADVVEVSPAYDHAQLTALAAAGVVYDLLALFAKRPLSTDDANRRTSGSA